MRVAPLIVLLFVGTAAAQLRAIPADAERAQIRHVQEDMVEINGQPARLAPGAQIRDESNRRIVPMSLPSGALVKYRRDASGQVSEVWILTPQEADESR